MRLGTNEIRTNRERTRIRRPKSRLGKIAVFGSSLLVGGLMLCTQPAAAQPPRDKMTRAAAIREMTKELEPGQEFTFGAPSKTMYSIKIKTIGKDSMTADIRFPCPAPGPTVTLVSNIVQFNDVVLPLGFMLALARAVRTEPVKRNAKTIDMSENYLLRWGLFGPFRYASMMGDILNSKKGMGELIANMVALGEDELPVKQPKVDFKIKSQNEKEIVFEVTKGKYKGKTVKLDRKMEVTIEFLFEKGGFLTMPVKIEKASLGKDDIRLTQVVDCSENVHMEFLTAEHASGKHPACKVQSQIVKEGDRVASWDGVKVIQIDSRGVVLEDFGRLEYGKEVRTGEFLLIVSVKAEKGKKPGTAKITTSGISLGSE